MRINKDSLPVKQKKLVKAIIEGKTLEQAATEVGVTKRHVSRMLKTEGVKTGIQVALDSAGLTEEKIAKTLRKTIKGAGKKATNSDAIRGIELISRLKGYITKEPDSVTNTYINELKVLSIGELQSRVDGLLKDLEEVR